MLDRRNGAIGSEDASQSAQAAGLDLRNLFLAGCWAGDRIRLVPLSDDEGTSAVAVPAELAGLQEVLRQLGIAEDSTVRPVFDICTAPPSADGLDAFMEAIKNVDEAIRCVVSPQQFRWFRLGDLIWEPVTRVELIEGVASNDDECMLMSYALSMRSLAEMMELPPALKAAIERHAATVEGHLTAPTLASEEGVGRIHESARRLAQTILLLL